MMGKAFAGGVSRLLGSSRLVKKSGVRSRAVSPFWRPNSVGNAKTENKTGLQVSNLVEEHVPALFTECDLSGSCEMLEDISSCSAVKQDLSEVQELLDAGTSLDDADEIGRTLLFLACDCGYLELVEALVNGGATIDLACGPDNRTPLQQAAFHGYESVVTFLLEKGASPTVSDENGHTALSLASASRHNDVAKILSNARQAAIESRIIDSSSFVCKVEGTNS